MTNRTRKRVLHAISLDRIGGVEVLFRAYLAHADKARLEHHVLLLRGDCHRLLAPTIQANAASLSFAKYRFGMKIPPRPALMRRANVLRVFREVRPDVTVIHNTPGNPVIWQAAVEHGGTIVYYEHGGAWRTRESTVPANLNRADVILCNSHAARRMLELRWGVRATRMMVRPNPLRPEVPVRTDGPRRELEGGVLRLGVAGRVIGVKGFPLALHALRHLSDAGVNAELMIAGDGPQRKLLKPLAERLGVKGKTRFLGTVEDISSFFDHLDVFLCPSLREPLGNVCIEAGARGCPVVCTRVDGLPEVVLNGRTGLWVEPTLPVEDLRRFGGDTGDLPDQVYDPKSDSLDRIHLPDPRHLAREIERLATDSKLYRSMSDEATSHISESHCFSSYVAEMDRLLALS